MINDNDFFVIAGPCVIESESLCQRVAETLANLKDQLGLKIYFKASFDKANRTSVKGFRGPGLDEGLAILERIKQQFELPLVTDVHETHQVKAVANVVDMLQTPAFLCRQTDFIQAVAQSNKPVNIKKGQFLSPDEMKYVIEKAQSVSSQPIYACERGSCFGYNNLVVDYRGLATMRSFAPVIFDATHSVQQPGGLGGSSGGHRHMVPVLAKAACAVGVDGLFLETHPNPDQALSDGPNMWPLSHLGPLLKVLMRINENNKDVVYG
ncbi:MAG: 3-deoxy-8-phosphooctulonate synthase [Candidatus Comchoanobacterales bacterium]